MKVSAILFTLGASVASAFQNLQSSDYQLNISSPLVDGSYVAGQILPYTYIPAIPSNLNLNLYLRGVNVAFNETVIAIGADISADPSSAIRNSLDDTVYYQHSVNCLIPLTTAAGNYEAVFHNVNTNTNTTISFTIRAAPVQPSIANVTLAQLRSYIIRK